MTTAPAIDVIIPVYNGQDYILDAIRSVEAQTLPPRQIIVIDDGSTDETLAIVQRYRPRLPVVLQHQDQAGPNAARNAGLKIATADYVAFLDADDVWHPNKLAEQVNVFQQAAWPDLGLVYCQYEVIDRHGQLSNKYYVYHLDSKNRGHIFSALLRTNIIAGSASGVLVKRSCFDVVGLFDEQLRVNEDWDMWLRLAQKFSFDYVDQRLVQIRRHQANHQNDRSLIFTRALSFYEKWIPQLAPQNTVPLGWVKNILTPSLQRLPRRDYLQLIQEKLSSPTKQELRRLARNRLKAYFAAHLLLIPAYVLRNLLRPKFLLA